MAITATRSVVVRRTAAPIAAAGPPPGDPPCERHPSVDVRVRTDHHDRHICGNLLQTRSIIRRPETCTLALSWPSLRLPPPVSTIAVQVNIPAD